MTTIMQCVIAICFFKNALNKTCFEMLVTLTTSIKSNCRLRLCVAISKLSSSHLSITLLRFNLHAYTVLKSTFRKIISLIKILNNRGPRIDPWDTPIPQEHFSQCHKELVLQWADSQEISYTKCILSLFEKRNKNRTVANLLDLLDQEQLLQNPTR